MPKTKNKQKNIIIKNAALHNLKNIDIEIPRNKLTVITGLSGSGKSSLAFDTLYAEGQRRFVESLSSYTMSAPRAIYARSLPIAARSSESFAATAIQRRSRSAPRSTPGLRPVPDNKVSAG